MTTPITSRAAPGSPGEAVMSKPTIDQLREQVRAPVITAGDPQYEEARAVHNGMFDKHPKAVIRAAHVADVIAGVNFARDAGLELSVRGGGHSAPGFGTTDDGVVIDLSPMRDVHVDPQAGTARAGGGTTWGDFNYATHAYGLATTGGIISTTGVGGLTLGGGIGYLARGYGLSIDNLRSAEVVTADGRVAMASEDENADLFWALRGGGGNFGVVTSFEFQLHPVDDICAAIVHWSGPVEEGEQAMAPFREIAPVVAEMSGPMPYPALNAAFDPLFPKGIRSYWKGSFATELTDAAIEQHVIHGAQVPEVSATMHLYPVNGACRRVGGGAEAIAPHSEACCAMTPATSST